jgi:hypothetical protein
MQHAQSIAKETINAVPTPVWVWVTEKTFAHTFNLNRQSLANWRLQDRRAGRSDSRPGYPVYKYFGHAVRYRIEAESIAPML